MAVKVNLGLNEEYMFFNDGYINCGDTTTMDGLTGFTIEFKVKMEFLNTYPTLTGARGHNFVNKGSYYNSASSFAIGMSETASSPATVQNRLFFSRGNSYYNYVNLYGGILTDTWYHMAFVQNDTGMYIYINGVQQGGAGQGTLGPIANTTHLLTIGGLINGKMDEIRIWNYPRTRQQIVDNMNLQLTAPVAGLIHLYQAKNFNNATGVLTDAAGSVNGYESAADKVTAYLAWRNVSAVKVNIGDTWKSVVGGWINIGDSWKRFIGSDPLVADILVVGSGGGGCGGGSNPYVYVRGGGGGGGQVVYTTGVTLTQSGYTVTVGDSQSSVAWSTSQSRSNSSSFDSLITAIGGMSAGIKSGNVWGGDSGSSKTGVQSTTSGYSCTNATPGGGGGGAGTNASGAKGGNGVSNSITGSDVYYAGGGKGGYTSDPGNSQGYNTYGAGGAGGVSCSTGGSSSIGGVVIIRYTSATQRATGGTVTTSGGDYIHTFTSSGTFTLT